MFHSKLHYSSQPSSMAYAFCYLLYIILDKSRWGISASGKSEETKRDNTKPSVSYSASPQLTITFFSLVISTAI